MAIAVTKRIHPIRDSGLFVIGTGGGEEKEFSQLLAANTTATLYTAGAREI